MPAPLLTPSGPDQDYRRAAIQWKLPFSRSELETALTAMLAQAGCPGCRVELALMGDREMERLHRGSLGRSGPTNVLSFAVRDSGEGSPEEGQFLGSLALSADTLARECFLYGQEPGEHCLRLLAHGLAHLLGHEHGQAMASLCRRLETAAADMLHSSP